jgi:hypothetical protein
MGCSDLLAGAHEQDIGTMGIGSDAPDAPDAPGPHPRGSAEIALPARLDGGELIRARLPMASS